MPFADSCAAAKEPWGWGQLDQGSRPAVALTFPCGGSAGQRRSATQSGTASRKYEIASLATLVGGALTNDTSPEGEELELLKREWDEPRRDVSRDVVRIAHGRKTNVGVAAV